MKNKTWSPIAALSITLAAATAACSAGDLDPAGSVAPGDEASAAEGALEESTDLGSLEQGLMSCANPDGTNSVMAAFAVAAAKELGRWQAGKDFVVFGTSGYSEASWGMQQAIKLQSGTDTSGQPRGKSRCADGKCAQVQALLDMQYDQANNQVYFQGSGTTRVLLSPAALRSRMVAKLREQQTCDSSARDGDGGACPREEHKLVFQSAAPGSCDMNFYFKATKPDGTALLYPNQLKNKLKFADQSNPYISFQNLGGGVVSVDPTLGLNPLDGDAPGNCSSACTKISPTPLDGTCCSCAGMNKKYVKTKWSAVTFLCQ
ncbi:MAG TPA: hypothetical protein VNN80_21770 [Polyangiaceae bacterium]|jgi:hypothetical protein|nr:hypothetical protein [Polyangiaceae bacterium]